jgi:nucleoside-diphosphate-sugar epimerase
MSPSPPVARSDSDGHDSVLVAGCGYVGARLAEMLVEDGVRVWGLKRDPTTLPAEVLPLAGDVTRPETLRTIPRNASALVYAVAPGSRSVDAYRGAYVDGLHNLLAALHQPPGRLVLVSSTGVYGHDDGRWVDETTDPAPSDETARQILEGESLALSAAPIATVLRLGGIYGPGRTRTVRSVLDGAAPCPPPDVYGNRIHRDDAAAAIRHLLGVARPERVYLGVDQDPAPLREVYRWIAARGGVADPCEGQPEPSAPVSMWTRRGGNKRCSSRRLVASGFRFRYPTYREGYSPLVDDRR